MRAWIRNEDYQYESTSNENDAEWLVFENPSEQQIDHLQSKYDIPRDFIVDSFDKYEVARQESFHSDLNGDIKLYLLEYPDLKFEKEENYEYKTLPISVIVMEEKTILIGKEIPDFIDNIFEDNKNLAAKLMPNESIEYTPFILELLWTITNLFIKKVETLTESIEDFESKFNNAITSKPFKKLISIHKSFVYFSTAIEQNNKIIKHLDENEFNSADNISERLIHDIKIVSQQADVMVNQGNKLITHLSEVFSSLVSHNLSIVMKFLSSVTIVLTVPSLVSELWGTNVPVPMEENPLGFPVIIILMVVLTIISIIWLKKKDYM